MRINPPQSKAARSRAAVLMPVVIAASLFAFTAAPAQASAAPQTTTYAEQTANNTSTCVAGSVTSPAGCTGTFTGQTDTVTPGVETPLFDAPAGNVSTQDVHRLLYPGSTTKVFATMMLGFCTQPDGSSSPTVPRCNSNVLTNYSSNDASTARAQVADIARRGYNGGVLDWYGGGSPVDQAALDFQSAIHDLGYCAAPRGCSVKYILMYDGSTLKWPVNATGVPGTTGDACPPSDAPTEAGCITARLKNDLCYMNGSYFGDQAYQKYALDGGRARPIVQFFVDEGGMYPNLPASGPAPSWSGIWAQVRTWSDHLSASCSFAPYNADNGAPLFIFENTPGFTHTGSDGAFDWINPTQDQDTLQISPPTTAGDVDNFYAVSKQYAKNKLVWGVAFKGFNDTQSAWGQDRLIDQRCGQTWLGTLASAGQYYSASEQLPFVQIATWNDYNEGTPIEDGISNCYAINAAVNGTTLSWDLSAGSGYASRSTIARFEVFDSTDGTHYRLIASLPRSRNSLRLEGLSAGTHNLFVKMIGESGFLNQASQIVTYK